MIQAESCYLNDKKYAIRDEEFLDRVITKLLAGKTLDEVIASDNTFTIRGGT